MADRDQKISTEILPPPTKVLACWQWYDWTVSGDFSPAACRAFDRKVSESKTLQRFCANEMYDLAWRHAVRSQLGAMWQYIQFPRLTIRKPKKRGRPAHSDGDFTFDLCVLDTLIVKACGESADRRQESRHWAVMASLLRTFFPDQCREADGWTPARVKARVNLYLRQHEDAIDNIRKRPALGEYWLAFGSRKLAAAVEARGESMGRLIGFIDAAIKQRRNPRRKPTLPGPTAIRFRFDRPA
jgi:hypothetical protein